MRNSRGFTLIELIVAIAAIGSLLVVTASYSTLSRSSSTARALVLAQEKIIFNWRHLSEVCGYKPAKDGLSASPIPGGGYNASDVLFRGRDFVATKYQSCYDRSAIRPFQAAVFDSATSVYRIEGLRVDLNTSGDPYCSAYLNVYGVSDDVLKDMVSHYGSGMPAVTASGSYGAPGRPFDYGDRDAVTGTRLVYFCLRY